MPFRNTFKSTSKSTHSTCAHIKKQIDNKNLATRWELFGFFEPLLQRPVKCVYGIHDMRSDRWRNREMHRPSAEFTEKLRTTFNPLRGDQPAGALSGHCPGSEALRSDLNCFESECSPHRQKAIFGDHFSSNLNGFLRFRLKRTTLSCTPRLLETCYIHALACGVFFFSIFHSVQVWMLFKLNSGSLSPSKVMNIELKRTWERKYIFSGEAEAASSKKLKRVKRIA